MIQPIVWDVNPEIINLGGGVAIKYYGLLFATGLALGFYVIRRFFLEKGMTIQEIDRLALYVFIGTIVGARLGHCLFYEPSYYLSHPLEILLPISIDDGQVRFTGFLGLASHGGILGVFIGILLYCKKYGKNAFEIMDVVVIGGALSGCFIRLANLMNSEILGGPTGGDYGFIFKRVDNIPRHPAQLYEAIAYFLIFVLFYLLYRKTSLKKKKGFLFGLFFSLLFLARFLIEFVKEDQVDFEVDMVLNMGQLLSIPFFLLGVGVMVWRRKTLGK